MKNAVLALGSLATFASGAAADIPMGSEKGVLDIILQHGITGAMLIIMLVAYIRKDKALDEERAGRLKDERDRNDVVTEAQSKLATLQEQTSALGREVTEVLRRIEQKRIEDEIRERAREDVRTAKAPAFKGPTR